MRPSILCAVALVAAAPSVHADWLLSDYAVVAADSAETNHLYGIQSFGNPSSVTSVVAPGGYVSLVASKLASEGSEGYTANVGLLHPLKRDWSTVALGTLEGISFEIRYSVKPTDGIEIGLGSKVIPKEESDAGHAFIAKLSGSLLPTSPNVWKTVVLSPEEFQLPTWWEDVPVDFPTLQEVLAGGVEQIQFAPKTAYSASGTQNGTACSKCVTPTTTAITLDIRNITLLGMSGPGGGPLNPLLEGCLDKKVEELDRFYDGDNSNDLGGSWFAYSDTSSDPLKALDSARGLSGVDLAASEGDADLEIPGLLSTEMGLHKKVGGDFDWRPYAGWAAIGTDFGAENSLDRPHLTGISFQLRARHLGPHIKGIRFKVALEGVDPSVTHFAFIPAAMIQPADPSFQTTICVRPSDLKQPDWFQGATPFAPTKIRQLSWEASIEDQINSAIADDSAAFTLSNVLFHGDSTTAIGRRLPRQAFLATYRDGMLSVQRVPGYDQVQVVSAQGKLLGRLEGTATRMALALDRGTYFVVARNAQGLVLSRALAVTR